MVFSAIPNIGFQGNDGVVTIFKGERFDSFSLPNWSVVHEILEKRFGGDPGIRNFPMEHFYGCQMWDSHLRFGEVEDLLPSLIPLIEDQCWRNFKTVATLEGHYFVPVERVGKREGYFAFASRLPHKIGLHITCGNGRNDRDMLTAVENLENGIAFWVGTSETKPPGTNVFAVPNEDALSSILGELGELLPIKN